MESPQARKVGVFNKSELVRKLVNEFLIEQEIHYENMESIDDFINEVEYGDHFVVTFNDEKQFEELVYGYVRKGMQMNAINVLVAMKNDESRFLRALRQIKNIDSLFNSQKIVFLYADDSVHNGRILLESILKKLDELEELVKKKSMKGLFVQGYFVGKIIEDVRLEDSYSYECNWHETALKNDFLVSVMCLYNSLSERYEKLFANCHHVILKRGMTKTGLQ